MQKSHNSKKPLSYIQVLNKGSSGAHKGIFISFLRAFTSQLQNKHMEACSSKSSILYILNKFSSKVIKCQFEMLRYKHFYIMRYNVGLICRMWVFPNINLQIHMLIFLLVAIWLFNPHWKFVIFTQIYYKTSY